MEEKLTGAKGIGVESPNSNGLDFEVSLPVGEESLFVCDQRGKSKRREKASKGED